MRPITGGASGHSHRQERSALSYQEFRQFWRRGAITTDNADLAERLRALRQYGWRQRFNSEEAGLNSRLDELQAAILRVKLSYLSTCNSRRQAIAKAYDQAAISSTSSAMRPPVRRANSSTCSINTFYAYRTATEYVRVCETLGWGRPCITVCLCTSRLPTATA